MTRPSDHGARGEYEKRRDARRERLARMERRERLISTLRLGVFALGLGLALLAWRAGLSVFWLAAPTTAFVVLVVLHEQASRRANRARRAAAHYDAGLRRLDGQWPGHGIVRDDLAPPQHPYAADLDLFGHGSLFERLCLARTGAGVQTLARWLLAPAPAEVVRQRQAAVEELRNSVTLREDLALAGEVLEAEIDPEFLSAWGERPSELARSKVATARAVAWVIAVSNVVATVAWAVESAPAIVPITTLAATWVGTRPFSAFTKQVLLAVERPRRELAVIAAVLRQLETRTFQAPRLRALSAELSSGHTSAAASIARLVRRVEWLDAQRSAVFAPVAFALAWGLHFGLAVDAWRCEHGPNIRKWFAALGELEALASLSAYAYERPEDRFPELVDGPPRLEGEALGHPLLSVDACVRNDVSLGARRRALVISGSNMSGKSTYLRTVGVAVVLGQAGAPVCADRLCMTSLRVGATLRVQDSLQGGASRFYAEITRLRAVMDVAEAGPGLLFLLDEILHGTNSHDRRIGAQAVIEGLLRQDGIGLVTTHDLALADAAESMPATVDNVHFADELRDGRLVFDYRMQCGPVKTSNALELMRAVGLRV